MNAEQLQRSYRAAVIDHLVSRGFPYEIAEEAWNGALYERCRATAPVENEGAWLKHVAFNRALDAARRKVRIGRHEQTLASADDAMVAARAVSHQPPPEDVVVAVEEMPRKQTALRDALHMFRDDSSAEQREILMRNLAGQGATEIAVRRAMDSTPELRDRLKPYLQSYLTSPDKVEPPAELAEMLRKAANNVSAILSRIRKGSLQEALVEVDPNCSIFSVWPGNEHVGAGLPSSPELLAKLIFGDGELLPPASIERFFANPQAADVGDVRFFLGLRRLRGLSLREPGFSGRLQRGA